MTETTTIGDPFDADLADLLTELSDVQRELLTVLAEKRSYLASANTTGLSELQPREESLINRLQACQHRRGQLLSEARSHGLPGESLTKMTAALSPIKRRQWRPRIEEAAARSRLLQHQSLTNWVLAQRTLIHLSQMLEIIATGGRLRPTYGKGESPDASGNLVDQEA